MRIRDPRATRRRGLAAVACALAIACPACRPDAELAPPAGWLANCGTAGDDGYGAWVVIDARGRDAPRRPLRGELIEVAEDSTFVLTDAGLVAVPTRRVVEVVCYSCIDDYQQIATNHYRLDSPLGDDWRRLRDFARFPAGAPPELDRRTLTPKP